jgi:hypothetical protein
MLEVTMLCGQMCIGKQGENLARIVYFPEFEEWKNTFGEGRCELLHQRHDDVAPYPVALDVEDGKVCWKITNADTAVVGEGKCELHYLVDGVVVKSKTWTTTVLPSLGEGAAEPPEPYQAWVDAVLEAAANINNAGGGGGGDVTSCKQPIIGENKNWFIWDVEKRKYVDTGVCAVGEKGADGQDGKDGKDGQDGYSPVRGADYWTDEDKAEIQQYVDYQLDEVESIAKGRATGYVFDTLADLDAWLSDSANTANLVLGDNLYIRATDVPDYWWDGASKQELETQKVDLSEYVKNTDYATENSAGVIKTAYSFGLSVNGNGQLYINQASNAQIDKRSSTYQPITPNNLEYAVKTVGDGYYATEEEVNDLASICNTPSINLYNPAIQTKDTISPHYYHNGVPYKTTQFDSSYNCTAPIPIDGGVQYTLGLVPARNGVTAPWGSASGGVFFYDASGTYISKSEVITFTTPVNATTMRFNFSLLSPVNGLGTLNAYCMLVKGDTLPNEFVAYGYTKLNERVDRMESEINKKPIQYSVIDDVVKVASRYTADTDLLITLKKKGGNNIFDFYEFATFPHGKSIEELTDANLTLLQRTTTDWHAPFMITASTNVDGDLPDSYHFTGGNHDYTNGGSGGTATGRTATLKVYADNSEITNDKGFCDRLEIKWTNFVQATNTKKVDGSGREVLQENHVLTFDGFEWVSHVELVPLEAISVSRWYGLQAAGVELLYKNVRYVGATNREVYDTTSGNSSCGDNKATKVICEGTQHRLEIEIDPVYDLGDRSFYSGTDGLFTSNGKVYFFIISGKSLSAQNSYYMRGKYRFSAI